MEGPYDLPTSTDSDTRMSPSLPTYWTEPSRRLPQCWGCAAAPGSAWCRNPGPRSLGPDLGDNPQRSWLWDTAPLFSLPGPSFGTPAHLAPGWLSPGHVSKDPDGRYKSSYDLALEEIYYNFYCIILVKTQMERGYT